MRLKLVQFRHMQRLPGGLVTETLSHANAVVKNTLDLVYDQARNLIVITNKKEPESPPFLAPMAAVLMFQPETMEDWKVRPGPGRPPGTGKGSTE